MQKWRNFLSKPSIPHVCVSFGLSIVTIFIANPMVPLIVSYAVNEDTSKAAIITGVSSAVGSLCGLIACPILGILADKYGRKPFLILNVISAGSSLTGAAILYSFPSQLWVVYVFEIISSILNTVWSLPFAYVADITDEKERSRSFGYIGATAGIAAVVGPGIVSGTSGVSLALPVYIGLGIFLVNIFWTSIFLPESHVGQSGPIDWKSANTLTSFKMIFSKNIVIGLVFGFIATLISSYGIIGTTVLYFQDMYGWEGLQIGLSMSLYGLVLMFTQAVLVNLATRYVGERRAILGGILLVGIVAAGFGLVTNGYYIFALMPFKSIGSIALPLLQSAISRQFSADVQGKLLGVIGALQNLTGFIGPLLFAFLYSYFVSDEAPTRFPQIIFFVACAIQVIAFCTLGAFFYKIPEEYPVFDEIDNESEKSPLTLRNLNEDHDDEEGISRHAVV